MSHDIDDVIVRLQAATTSSRRVDGMIAQILGWRLTTENYFDANAGERKQRQIWLLPHRDEIAKVPPYTASFTAAYELSKLIAPKARTGLSWENGRGSARIGDGPYVQSISGPIALCIASLHALKMKTSIKAVQET